MHAHLPGRSTPVPGSEAATPAARAFLCDEMLSGLGRWLRAAGYDTAIARPGLPDHRLLEWAAGEARLMLTCDRELAVRRGSRGLVLTLGAGGLDGHARELRKRLALDWLHAPFTRCLVDNAALRPARRDDWHRIPAKARQLGGPVRTCPACARLYWPGSHVRRMQARLAAWQGLAEARSVETYMP